MAGPSHLKIAATGEGNGPGASPSEILARAQAGRFVVQDFCPLAESIEWKLGQHYFHERGSQAFIGDPRPVPFAVNNDGTLSINAAEVFYSSLEAAEEEGPLEPEIFVLELGVGVGLFARFFLDHFRDLCRRSGKDYYDRLTYVAADRSERMLLDLCRHGIFANHPGHYLLRVVDAQYPDRDLADDLAFANHPGKPFRAIFLNYVLDCLPAAVLEIDGDEVRQLCIRTCLARHVDPAEYTDLDPEDIARRANSSDPADARDLIAIYDLFASEFAYRPADIQGLPYGAFAVEFARPRGRYVMHNYGAFEALERLLTLVHERAFILIDDYGHVEMGRDQDDYSHQRFSRSTAIGLNFALLKALVEGLGGPGWFEPDGDHERIYSRLVGPGPARRTIDRFRECFGKAAYEGLHKPVAEADASIEQGRFEAAATAYQEALARQPRNWMLMSEAAKFLAFSLRDHAAGLAVARAALELNPACSAELWNTLGDCLFLLGRVEEARHAFTRAKRVNPDDVRSRFNLSFVLVREKEYAEALSVIAEGLALDRAGIYWEGLLKQQSEVLGRLEQRRKQECHFLADRVTKTSSRTGAHSPPSGTQAVGRGSGG